MNTMRFRAKYVSASGNGEYYQVAFENTDLAGEAADVDSPDTPRQGAVCDVDLEDSQ
jgi:hypothetical protein